MKRLVMAMVICLGLAVGAANACTLQDDALVFKDVRTCLFMAELMSQNKYLEAKELLRDGFAGGFILGIVRGARVELVEKKLHSSKRGPVFIQKIRYRGRTWFTPPRMLECGSQ